MQIGRLYQVLPQLLRQDGCDFLRPLGNGSAPVLREPGLTAGRPLLPDRRVRSHGRHDGGNVDNRQKDAGNRGKGQPRGLEALAAGVIFMVARGATRPNYNHTEKGILCDAMGMLRRWHSESRTGASSLHSLSSTAVPPTDEAKGGGGPVVGPPTEIAHAVFGARRWACTTGRCGNDGAKRGATAAASRSRWRRRPTRQSPEGQRDMSHETSAEGQNPNQAMVLGLMQNVASSAAVTEEGRVASGGKETAWVQNARQVTRTAGA